MKLTSIPKIKEFVAIVLLSLSYQGYGQVFDITTIEQTPDELIVHYDLIDTTRDRYYTVYLYLLTDSTISPVKEVSGNIGLEVLPGVNNKIIWASRKELGENFKGKIQLEVRGKVYIPFIEFEGFPAEKELKRGKTYDFAWNGKSSSNILEFKLYRDKELTAVLPEVANTGDAKIHIPSKIKPGKYRFFISDSRNKDQEVHSPVFYIKPRIHWAVKAASFLLIGGGAYYGLSNGDEKGPAVEGPPGIPDN